MTMLTRKQFLMAAAASAAGGGFPRVARAADFTFKLGHAQPATHPHHLRSLAAADKINKESNGRMIVRVYPNSQLGSDTQMLAQLRSGALEMMHAIDSVIAGIAPAASVTAIPFAFDGYPELWTAMDGEFGMYVHAQIEKIGVHVFEKGWDAGMRHVFTTSKPIRSPDDLKGLKIRVPEAPIILALFRALGASPTALNVNELYMALQTHLVDGAEQPLISMEAAKYSEVSKYITLTNHQPTTYELLANAAAWRRLPADLQEIMSRNFNEAALLERADIANGDIALTARLKAGGQTFINPDRKAFRAVLQRAGLYSQWRDAYDKQAFALLEKSLGTQLA